MGSLVTATVHGTKDGKEYTGKSLEYSVKQYAYNKLKADTTDDKFKTMLVDMLNYGAAAQEYWGYNPKNLVNAELTDEQKAYLPTYANKSKPGVDGDGHWQENFAMISTWNEYGEGTYIMPSDGLHGFEYLDALREVYSGGGAHTDVKPTAEQKALITHNYPQDIRLLRRNGEDTGLQSQSVKTYTTNFYNDNMADLFTVYSNPYNHGMADASSCFYYLDNVKVTVVDNESKQLSSADIGLTRAAAAAVSGQSAAFLLPTDAERKKSFLNK